MSEISTVRDDASRSLISGVALMLLVGTGGVWALGLDDWRTVALVGASAFSFGFFGVWALLLNYRLPRQERVMPTPAQRAMLNAEIAAVPLVFDARDAREFVRAALLRVNGKWSDRDGGASVRAMEAKGWSRERWNMAVGWLMENRLLKWRDEAEHRAGLEWDFEKLDKFMEVKL